MNLKQQFSIMPKAWLSCLAALALCACSSAGRVYHRPHPELEPEKAAAVSAAEQKAEAQAQVSEKKKAVKEKKKKKSSEPASEERSDVAELLESMGSAKPAAQQPAAAPKPAPKQEEQETYLGVQVISVEKPASQWTPPAKKVAPAPGKAAEPAAEPAREIEVVAVEGQ